MKKLVLLMAVILLCSLIATATGQPETETVGNDEMMEISIAQWGFAEFGNDKVAELIMEEMNITLDIFPMTWSDSEQQVNLWGAADELPDLFGTYTIEQGISRFYDWIDQELVRDIPKEMVAKYPLTKKLFDSSSVLQGIDKVKDGYYFIPRPGSAEGAYKAWQVGLYYRMDWAENVGITKRPETLDELYEMARAFTFDDPDGNGIDDTYGIISGRGISMHNIFGIDMQGWIYEDGRYIPGFASKENADSLLFWQKMIKAGILEPEFAINNSKQMVNKFTTGTGGIVIRNADNYWINKVINTYFKEANPNVVDPFEIVGLMAPFEINGESKWIQLNDSCGTEISADVSDAKLDRILKLTNYLLSPEVMMTRHYGIKDIDYTIENGKAVLIKDPETGELPRIFDKYPSLQIFTLTDWGWDWDISEPGNPNISPKAKILGSDFRKRGEEALVVEDLSVRLISTPIKDTLPVFNNFGWEDFTMIIIGDKPADEAYAEWLESQMKQGLDQAITDVNEKYKALNVK